MSAPTEDKVNEIIAAMQQAEAASDYAGHQLCEMQLISGEDYNMAWSTATAGNFPPAQ